MNGYQYLVQRNRLMIELEDELKQFDHLPESERRAAAAGVQARFDVRLKQLYAQVADEFPGERKVKARPLTDPR